MKIREVIDQQRVLLMGSYRGNPFPLWRGMDQAAESLGDKCLYLDTEKAHEQIEEISAFDPTVSLVVNTNPRRIARMGEALRKAGVRGAKGVWHNDLRPPNDWLRRCKNHFTTAFLCWNDDPGGTYDWTNWKATLDCDVAYMPQGSPLMDVKSMPEIGPKVLFIGDVANQTYHQGRKEWTSSLGATIINQGERAKRIRVEKDTPRLYRTSRYCLVHSPCVNGYNSLRLYNVLGCGGLALVKHFPGVERLFNHGEHALIAKDVSHALRLIAEYDSKSKESRDKVRLQGHLLQQAKHSTTARIRNMVYALATGDNSFWGWL